jgi:hypothetical protein
MTNRLQTRSARRAEETTSLAYAQRVGAKHAYLDAPRTVGKVGERGPYTPAPTVASDDVRAMREMACAAYEAAIVELCGRALPFAEHNAESIAIGRRRAALLAAIGGAS